MTELLSDGGNCRTLYLDLLKTSITGMLFQRGKLNLEGSDDEQKDLPLLTKALSGTLSETERSSYSRIRAAKWYEQLVKGNALTVLTPVRLDNIQNCVVEVLTREIPGDLIETGVWRGGATILMRGILKAYGVTDRSVWVADSFQGLPEPSAARHPVDAQFYSSEVNRTFNNLAVSLEAVRENFDAYNLLDDNVKFIKGWFKDTLPRLSINKLALIRHDGDFYESTMDVLNNLYDKLSMGGIVIIDDYGAEFVQCTEAVDEFRKCRNITDDMIKVDFGCCWWRKTVM